MPAALTLLSVHYILFKSLFAEINSLSGDFPNGDQSVSSHTTNNSGTTDSSAGADFRQAGK